MPTESELRALLQGDGTPGALDTERIIRRARARRRPKQLAVGALGGLAALAVVVPVVVGVGSLGPASVSDSGGAAAPAHPESADEMTTLSESEGAPADAAYSGCELPRQDGDAAASGVEVLVSRTSPEAPVTLTLMNGGSTALHGELAGARLLAIGDADRPLAWADTQSVPPGRIDLAPGEQLSFEVPLELVACSDAPVAGDLAVEARLAIVLDDGTRVVATSTRTLIDVGEAP